MDFEFGTLDFNDYDGSYAYINVVNTTGDPGSLIQPGVDFINGEIWFSLATDDSGSNQADYHLILNDSNNDNEYDWLTGIYYDSKSCNSQTGICTYNDGEKVSSIGPGKSLLNLVDTISTQTLIPYQAYYDTYTTYDLYINSLKFQGNVRLNNFNIVQNGITYSYDGDLLISGSLFTNDWYSVNKVASWPGSSANIKGNIPQSPSSSSVPEPSTFYLIFAGIAGLFYIKNSNHA